MDNNKKIIITRYVVFTIFVLINIFCIYFLMMFIASEDRSLLGFAYAFTFVFALYNFNKLAGEIAYDDDLDENIRKTFKKIHKFFNILIIILFIIGFIYIYIIPVSIK